MIVLADEAIPCVDAYCAGLATQIRRLPGRSIDAQAVKEVDILLVRSITLVDAALLQGSAVRFVGTTTIGCDHVDTHYLAQQGIEFAYAPGCNAAAVVDYVLSVLAWCHQQGHIDVRCAQVGVIGCGRVGGQLLRCLQQLGVAAMGYDPFVRLSTQVHSLEALMAQCNLLCLHTPLTRLGPHPTWHLLNAQRVAQLAPGTLVINAGRGAVLTPDALLQRRDLHWVLDVWPDEPCLSQAQVQATCLSTPHIAGYSVEGKLRGLQQVMKQCYRWLGQPEVAVDWQLPPVPPLSLQDICPHQRGWAERLLALYNPESDSQRLREALALSPGTYIDASCFDRLRKHSPLRREFNRAHWSL